jgi:hypothetical protein
METNLFFYCYLITFKIHKMSFKMAFVATCSGLTTPSLDNYQLEEITTRQYYHGVTAHRRIWEMYARASLVLFLCTVFTLCSLFVIFLCHVCCVCYVCIYRREWVSEWLKKVSCEMFPRNVGWLSADYTTLYPRGQDSPIFDVLNDFIPNETLVICDASALRFTSEEGKAA